MLQLLQVDEQWRKNGGTKFTSCNLKVHWRSDTCHDVYNVVKNIDVVKKKFKTWNHRRTMKNTGGDLSVVEKTQKKHCWNSNTLRRFCRKPTQSTFRSFRLTLSRGPQTVPVRIPRPSPKATSSPSVFLAVAFFFFKFCLVSFLAGRRVFFLCGVYFECWFSFIGSSFRWNECILQCNLCSVWVMFFVNGMSCWERSLFPNRSFPWQTCFLVKVGKRLALCTWLCRSSYSTAIKASQKLQHSKQKRVHPYRITIKRKVRNI